MMIIAVTVVVMMTRTMVTTVVLKITEIEKSVAVQEQKIFTSYEELKCTL